MEDEKNLNAVNSPDITKSAELYMVHTACEQIRTH